MYASMYTGARHCGNTGMLAQVRRLQGLGRRLLGARRLNGLRRRLDKRGACAAAVSFGTALSALKGPVQRILIVAHHLIGCSMAPLSAKVLGVPEVVTLAPASTLMSTHSMQDMEFQAA